MTPVNEGTSVVVSVALRNPAGAPEPPQSVVWSIFCMTNKRDVVSGQTIAAPGATFSIDVPGSANAILRQANATELRRLKIVAVYGAQDHLVVYTDWSVKNLSAS